MWPRTTQSPSTFHDKMFVKTKHVSHLHFDEKINVYRSAYDRIEQSVGYQLGVIFVMFLKCFIDECLSELFLFNTFTH